MPKSSTSSSSKKSTSTPTAQAPAASAPTTPAQPPTATASPGPGFAGVTVYSTATGTAAAAGASSSATSTSEPPRISTSTYDKKKLKGARLLSAVIPEGTEGEFCKTYIMRNQGHTLGNALKFVLMHYPEVKFCGYTQPHPSEDLIHLRLQTFGIPTDSVLRKGLEDLKSMAQIIEDDFKEELGRFNNSSS